MFYTISLLNIASFHDKTFYPDSAILFADADDRGKKKISIYERNINPPLTQEVINAQNETIKNDLLKAANLLKIYDQAKINEVNNNFKKA